MADIDEIPETHVLAIASHVASGYVGNTMATFCLQTLGCEVTAINTVNYSNHVGYTRFSGRKTTPEELADLYSGLQSAHLHTSFDTMLSGYCPSALLVQEIGKIARDLKLRASTKPGSFFWALDPVMGDNGRMYVAEDTLPAYKVLLKDADLVLPNQFEAELLSGVKINGMPALARAVGKLHREYGVPHVVITSVRLPSSTPTGSSPSTLSIIGSTCTSTHTPRLFRLTIPELPIFFSGTGDMFASLLLARLRQAAHHANLLSTAAWQSPDDVLADRLPLASAVRSVLASMQAVLEDTARFYGEVVEGDDGVGEGDEEGKLARHLKRTRAAEVRVVRNARALRERPGWEGFGVEVLDVGEGEEAEGVREG